MKPYGLFLTSQRYFKDAWTSALASSCNTTFALLLEKNVILCPRGSCSCVCCHYASAVFEIVYHESSFYTKPIIIGLPLLPNNFVKGLARQTQYQIFSSSLHVMKVDQLKKEAIVESHQSTIAKSIFPVSIETQLQSQLRPSPMRKTLLIECNLARFRL